MRLLSFDVGIKNLSFCILDYNENKIQINQWEVIDLCNEKTKCIEIKNDTPCNKPSKYYKNNEYYCQTHSKKKEYEIPPENLREKILKKMNLDLLLNMAVEYNITIDKPHTKNKVLEKILEYKSGKYFDTVDNVKANDYNLVELGINLRDKLDILLNISNIDLVLIENQISPIANRMKTIQGMIAQYLIMRGVNNIVFYSASNKLKTFIGGHKTSYSERKQLSVSYTIQILAKTLSLNDWISFFSSHKKKDDLADSFLQGISYLIQKYPEFKINLV
jgi:hypothetical protein